MQSIAIAANNYDIIGRMIEVLDIISSVTENTSLYRKVNKIIIQLEDIKNNYRLNWYDPIIGYHPPNLLIELHTFFAYRGWWQEDFIITYNIHYGVTLLNELLQKIEDIVLDLDKIMHIDYDKMRQDRRDFFVDLNKYVLKPERLEKISGQFGLDLFDYLDALDI